VGHLNLTDTTLTCFLLWELYGNSLNLKHLLFNGKLKTLNEQQRTQMSRKPEFWKGRYPVHSYEIGPDGFVRMPSMCNFLQDAAGRHARELGVSVDQLLLRGMTWMLSRLRVKVQRLPQWGDTVDIETWPADVQRLFAIRDFQLSDQSGKKIGVATSAWLLIDTGRKRPVRIPEDIRQFHPTEPVRALEMDGQKIASITRVDVAKQFDVRLCDLDLNRHVNNVSYIEWALETVPENFQESHQIRELEVEFLAEGVYGDSVCADVQLSSVKRGDFVHHLRRVGDERELVRARSVWERV
jgi:acyl-ACP thioesterase